MGKVQKNVWHKNKTWSLIFLTKKKSKNKQNKTCEYALLYSWAIKYKSQTIMF